MEEADDVSEMKLTVDGATIRVLGLLVTVPLEAVIVVVPAARPLARPALLMLATAGLLDVHVNVSPDIGVPLASIAVATNGWV